MPEDSLVQPQQKRTYEREVSPKDKQSRWRRHLGSDVLIKGRLPFANKSPGKSWSGKSKAVAGSEGTNQRDGAEPEVEEPEVIPPYNDCIYSVTPECIRGKGGELG